MSPRRPAVFFFLNDVRRHEVFYKAVLWRRCMKLWERNRTLYEVLLARRSATVILLEVL